MGLGAKVVPIYGDGNVSEKAENDEATGCGDLSRGILWLVAMVVLRCGLELNALAPGVIAG